MSRSLAALLTGALGLGAWLSGPATSPAPEAWDTCGVALGLFATDPGWDYRRFVDEIDAHGASDLLVVTPWVQPDVTSSTLAPRAGRSPSEATLRRTLRDARARGLEVTLMPVVQLEALAPGLWRGALAPDDPRAWRRAYRELLLDHARLGAEEGAVRLIVGSELASLEVDDAWWRALVAEVRAVFPGTLTYSANWDRFEHVGFWDVLDEVGVSAWFELDPDEVASGRAWDAPLDRLRRVRERTGRPVLLTEVGFPARATAAERPWDHAGPATPDPALQAHLYAALMARLSEADDVSGAFIWNWFGHGGHRDAGYSPRGRPAAATIRRTWTRWCGQESA